MSLTFANTTGLYSHTDHPHDHSQHHHDDDHHHDDHEFDPHAPKSVWEIPGKVWGFSFLAVTIISLCGLLGVAIVPLMRRMFYNHLLQFLVALAVGTLSGDALLHLLPHAITSSSPGSKHVHGTNGDELHGDDDHVMAIWKGLTACLGIHFFFLVERIMGIFSQWRQRMNQRRSRASFRSPRRDAFEQQLSIIEEAQTVMPRRQFSRKALSASTTAPTATTSLKNPAVVGAKLSNHQLDCHSCENIMMVVHPGKSDDDSENSELISLKQLATAEHHNEAHCPNQKATFDEDDPTCHSDDEMESCMKDYQSTTPSGDPQQPAEVLLPAVLSQNYKQKLSFEFNGSASYKAKDGRDRCSESSQRHSHHSHGHSHGPHGHAHHGHAHDVPANVSSVAWMVIMGDGIHNFTDGMAIGAAFATSVTTGFSTSIAVFCHELPHELGDFAVLLKAGMSTKQALTYNVVSSVLCLFGMIVGIIVGNISNASYWVFCATAGLFLYISLVDMVPELTVMESKPGESPLVHLLIQNAGILSGFGIMLLIAIYEHDIQTVFE